jgi:uncharacterized protein YecE (DUF72 family)
MKKEILIGTSGYTYQHWRKVFYPGDLKPNKWLEFYTQHFNTVELNVTFYRLPSKKVFRGWHNKTPRNFKFVIKGSRFITHIKRLKDPKEPLKIFFENAAGLEDKLLCVLWQLPPSSKCDLQRLENFVKILKKNYSHCLHSFEFRNQSWFNKEVFSLLKNNDMNLCIADSPDFPAHEIITSSFLYLRFHGGKILYGSRYSTKELKSWAEKAKTWLKKTNFLLAFFNNDAHGFAIKNALKFKELLK